MRAIDELGMPEVMRRALRDVQAPGVHLHLSFDVDFLDPEIAPGTGTPMRGGPTYREAQLCMEMLADTGCLGSVDLVELNPALDVRNQTAELVLDLLQSLFGKSTLARAAPGQRVHCESQKMPFKKGDTMLRKRFAIACALALHLGLGPAMPAHALGDAAWGYSTDYLDWSIRSDMAWRSLKQYQDAVGFSGKGGGKSKARQDEGPKLDPRAYEYTYSAARSEKVKQDFIDRLVKRGRESGHVQPAQERALRQELGRIEFMATVRKTLQGMGHNPDSLASATAYWLLVNHGIAYGRESSNSQNKGVVKQFQRAYSDTPSMRKLSDAQKQEVAETMYWLATLQHLNYQQAKGDPRARAAVKAEAIASARAFGVDFERLKLTHFSGFQAP
jgi:arginase